MWLIIELGFETFVCVCFVCESVCVYVSFKEVSKYFEDLFLLEKLKNRFEHLNHSSYIKNEYSKISQQWWNGYKILFPRKIVYLVILQKQGH